MSNCGIVNPNENRQYDLSKLEEDDVDCAEMEIKNVKEVMSKLADQLVSIEKGMNIKLKQDKVNKVVRFDMKKMKCM